MSDIKFVINAKTGVGSILLGAPITSIAEGHDFELVNTEIYLDGRAWYQNEDDQIDVYADENGNIEDIFLEKSAILFGHDLIGMCSDEAIEAIGRPVEKWERDFEMLDDEKQDIAYIDSLGLSLWFSDGHVVTVVVDDGGDED